MKKKITLFAVIIFLMAAGINLAGCDNTDKDSGKTELPYGDYAGIHWKMDLPGHQLKLSRLSERDESLQGQEYQCKVSVYDSKGKKQAKAVQTISADSKKEVVEFDEVDEMKRYRFKLSFTDKEGNPLIEETEWNVSVEEPNCENKGYTLVAGGDPASSYYCCVQEKLEHDYGSWETIQKGDKVNCEKKQRICKDCGYKDKEVIYPNTDLPLVKLYGSLEGISKDVEVPIKAAYASPEENFKAYATLKYQGHSTLAYEKHNYTMKFYNDKERQDKQKHEFKDWHEESKYILKANYLDTSQCRNLVSADVWGEVASSRKNVKHIDQLSNYGAVEL